MTYRTIFLSLVIGVMSCHTQASDVARQVSPGGLDYTLIKMPGNSRVSVQIAWPTNWAFNKDNNQAVPHVGARLLLAGGATDYSPNDVIERFEDMGSEAYLAPTAEYIFGTIHFSPTHQDETLDIVNAHLKQPALEQRWLERIRGQFSAQMSEAGMAPGATGFNASRWAIFGEQPLREALSMDDIKSIDAVTQDEAQSWVDSVLTRHEPIIVIAGDVGVHTANEIVDTIFENVRDGEAVETVSVDADFSPKRIVMHTPDAQTSTVSFIGKLPPYQEGFEFEDHLLTTALGNGPQSVLAEAVREDLRASYAYQAGMNAYTIDNRILILTGQVDTDKLAEAETVIRNAYDEFLKTGPAEELTQLQAPFREHLTKLENDTGSMAYNALLRQLYDQKLTSEFSVLDTLDAVTEQTLEQRLALSFPKTDELIVIVSSPDENALKDACVITEARQAVDC